MKTRTVDDLDDTTFDVPEIVVIEVPECSCCGGDKAPSESSLCTFCAFVMSFDAAEIKSCSQCNAGMPSFRVNHLCEECFAELSDDYDSECDETGEYPPLEIGGESGSA